MNYRMKMAEPRSPAKSDPRWQKEGLPLMITDRSPERMSWAKAAARYIERLADRHGTNLPYCHPWGKWLGYTGEWPQWRAA
jgi:hypothetical protein